ncbi:MAG TPA: tetratricopeptide repeat protein [Bryobacteraceae bacterium]|nr:tetratricopeptide repeat protein [Bryobacteraceae bacterium]
MRTPLPLLLVALLAAPLAAQDLVERGFDHFYNLEYDEALRDFQQAIVQHPELPDLHNHVAEALVFREMFRDGALESELVSGDNSFLRRPRLNPTAATEREFLGEVATAMSLAQARLNKNANDTSALNALGIAYGLRANYNWVVRKAWHDSLSDATAARRQHNRILQLEPGNVDAQLVQGLHDYIVGSLPVVYRMVGFLAGIRGDKEKGIRTIQNVARNGRQNRVDAEIFLCALYRRENRPLDAVPLLTDLIRRFPRNFLLRMELSQMYSVAGDGTKALAAIEDLKRLKNSQAPGLERLAWEKIYYQEGTIQFWYRDLPHALENLTKVVASPEEVDLNTGAYAYLRIGQIYDMTERRAEALSAYRRSIAFAPEAEAARESRKYLIVPYRRL